MTDWTDFLQALSTRSNDAIYASLALKSDAELFEIRSWLSDVWLAPEDKRRIRGILTRVRTERRAS